MKRIIFAILPFFVLPVVVFAVDNVNYKISNFYVEANILDNGDMHVKELIVQDGSFNGNEREIYFKHTDSYLYDGLDFEHSTNYNADAIKDLKISAKYINNVTFDSLNDDDFEEMEKVDYATKGEKGVYTLNEYSDHISFRMYYESRGKKVGYLIEYTLEKPVVIHNDVAEIFWTYFTTDASYNGDTKDEYKDFIFKIYLPGEDTKETCRFWGHGPLYGEIHGIKNGSKLVGAVASAKPLEKEDEFSIRITFNKDLITDDYGLVHTDVDGLPRILEVEERLADEANSIRESLRKTFEFCENSGKVLSVLNILGLIFMIFKYGVKPRTDFEAKYYREFIEDYPVEVIDYLYNKNITPKALSAGIMNLVYKKVCHVEEILDPKGKSKKKNYKFILDTREGLSDNDEKLVSFLFDTVGKNDEFTTNQLKSYASSLSTGSKFQSNYTKWEHIIKRKGEQQGFFKSKTFGGILTFILSALSFLLLFYGINKGVDSFYIVLPVLTAIVVIIYIIAVKAYNKKGALHIKKWNAFKNFLNDFGTFDVKELPEIALWERYLVYATIFGLAKKVQKSIEVKIKELGMDESTYTTTYSNILIYDSISHSFSNAVSEGKRAYAASRANAYSSHSSGGGFGGGFSGGGGSFGGGGGGSHGF